MLHMSGVGAARLLAEPGDHPPAAGPVGTRGLLQTHPQCRGFLPTPQVSVLVPSIFSPLTKLVSNMFSTFNITIVCLETRIRNTYFIKIGHVPELHNNI